MDPSQPQSTQTSPPVRKSRFFVVGIIVFVLACGVGLYLGLKHHHQHPEQHLATSYTATISIKENGFVPAYLLVKPNTTVIWRNTDKTGHQVSITTYSGDSKQSKLDKGLVIRAGDNYTLAFNDKGVYQYSDPLHPGLKGAIEVK